MTKKYTLTTSEETVTEHPEDIIRLMKLAGLENAQVVAEDDSEFEPTEANDKLDLDDYSKNSPESIAKQKKTIQPTLGDNPLEYSLDETEIQEALTKEFDKPEELDEKLASTSGNAGKHTYGYKDDPSVSAGWGGNRQDKGSSHVGNKINQAKKIKTQNATVHAESEEVTEELTAGQKKLPDALQKSILAKQGKKDETKETKETTVEENLEKAEAEIKELKEDCSCGHGSSCDCGPDCGCGCNAVNEDDSENWTRERESERHAHVNGSRETEEIEDLIRPFWSKLPEKLQLDLEMHFDSLKGEFDEAQEVEQSQDRIKKLMNY